MKLSELSSHGEGKTLDRRTRRTLSALQTAVLDLLQTHKLNEITINQLADAADINRRTFYSHFTSVEEVLESKIVEELSAFEQEMTEDLFKIPIQYEKIIPILIKHAALQGDNLELVVKSGAEHVMNIALERTMKELHKKALRVNHAKELDSVVVDYIAGFAIGACVGLVNKWISRGRAESIATVTALFIDLSKPFIDRSSDIAKSLEKDFDGTAD